MKATVLVDNIGFGDLCGEWGLSFYIEHQGRTILMDTGASGLFAENAAELGADLEKVEYGVLSHAHYDHADGLDAFFSANRTADFYMRRGTAEDCFDVREAEPRYIGIRRGILREYADRIVYVDGLYELYPGAYLLGHSTPGLSAVGEKAFMGRMRGGRMRADDFAHEQSLVLEENGGLSVFSSCSHAGIRTILGEVREAFPGKPLRAALGGFHLYASAPEEVRQLGRELRQEGVGTVVTGHCTGQEAYDILKEELGDSLSQMYTGMVIEL